MATPTLASAAGAGVTPQGGTPVPMPAQIPPFAVTVANFLRENKTLKNRGGLLANQQEVDFFRYKRFARAIQGEEYQKKLANPASGLPPVKSDEDVAKLFVLLIQGRMLVPVEKLHYDQIKEMKWKPNRQRPTLKPTQKAVIEPDAYYAWIYVKPNPYLVLYGFLFLVAVFAVILFPLWPAFMRRGVWYLSMLSLVLLGLFFAMAIVRLIIFCVTYLTMPRAFWLYPNLFEDCGFFESFVPLYAWSDTDKKLKKKRKGAKIEEVSEAEAATIEGEGEAVASGSAASQTAAKKRTVTLEEVAE